MTSAKILFAIPERVDEIARILSENFGSLEGMDTTEIASDVAAHLASRTGEIASVEFEDDDDPLEGVHALAGKLREMDAPHFGVTPAFEERSRGIRCEGRVFLCLGGEHHERDFPWKDGDPELDERTLRAVGIAEGTVAAVAETFFSGVPAPRY